MELDSDYRNGDIICVGLSLFVDFEPTLLSILFFSFLVLAACEDCFSFWTKKICFPLAGDDREMGNDGH